VESDLHLVFCTIFFTFTLLDPLACLHPHRASSLPNTLYFQHYSPLSPYPITLPYNKPFHLLLSFYSWVVIPMFYHNYNIRAKAWWRAISILSFCLFTLLYSTQSTSPLAACLAVSSLSILTLFNNHYLSPLLYLATSCSTCSISLTCRW